MTDAVRLEPAPQGITTTARHVGYLDTDVVARVDVVESHPAVIGARARRRRRRRAGGRRRRAQPHRPRRAVARAARPPPRAHARWKCQMSSTGLPASAAAVASGTIAASDHG